MNILAIIQARMGSTRLPGKVMMDLSGKPVIEHIFSRLASSKHISKIILATSEKENDDVLAKFVESIGYEVYRSSENNVLERFYKAANFYSADAIVRITGDCPMIDAGIIDSVIDKFKRENYDYVSNTNPPTFPDGLDVEIFTIDALNESYTSAKNINEFEHVTPYIRENQNFRKANFSADSDYSDLRLTLDESADFKVIARIFKHFYPKNNFSWLEVLKLFETNPKIFYENSSIHRNMGSLMNNGQKLWTRAKEVIPGGNMLLSKRPEMFLPDQWPSYFSKAKGCYVWDLDNKKLTDMSIMGIGTNILGYGNSEVDEAVISTVNKGNMSTLNCPEEVYLAEKMISMHKWSDMARFARSGGEANAIAIRIARAFTGKDNVAICGYHGWHDWYLSANLSNNKELDGHLLPGLQPNGVPRGLLNTVFPFSYNNIKELEEIIATKQIGVIKMEVSRNEGPQNNFLNEVRRLASENNIVLIFDECTSGFRESFGGLHLKYDVEPDIAMFGKALGNGYAITAILGRKEVMQSAQSSFISSTFWTERIGPTAALKTLEVMEKTKSWEFITSQGNKIKKRWSEIAKENNLDIKLWGLDALAGFTILSENSLKYKTYITQEMLKENFLASNSVYVSVAHNDEIIDSYFEKLEPIFKTISQCEDNRNIDDLIESPICHSGFKRLN